jgi:hypothetical protein
MAGNSPNEKTRARFRFRALAVAVGRNLAHITCIYIYIHIYTWYNWEHLGIFQLSPTVARFFGEQLASGIINCWWNVLAINWFNWMKGNRYTFPFLGCTSEWLDLESEP